MYPYTIGFIESFLEQIYMISAAATGSVFLSLLLLAVFVRLVTQPLARSTEQIVQHQSSLDQVLNQQVQVIKQQLQGEDRHRAIERLYQRFSYSPLLAVRSLAGLAVQLPFFIAAYYMLDTTPVLDGTTLPLIGSLDDQDKILFGEANLLPFVMLAMNIVATRLAFDRNRRQNTQGIFIAVLFFAILYDKNAGLVLYWTLANALTITSALYNRYGLKPAKFAFDFPSLKFARLIPSDQALALTKYFTGATLAVSWPMIDLMSKNETFFLVHSFSRSSIFMFLVFLILAPTLILFLIRLLVGLRFSRAAPYVDHLTLFGLFLLFSLYLINSSLLGMTGLGLESTLYFILSTLLALLLLQIIQTLNLLRLLSWICLLALVPALNFIYRAPSSSLFSAASPNLPYDDIDVADTPVFLIIFDEFSGLTLQNSRRQLNAQRYPGFARLAEQADYFPNGVSVTHNTRIAIPSIASGTMSVSGLKRDDNILDMLRFVTDVNVQSKLLPPDLAQSNLRSLKTDKLTGFNLGLVMDDLITIYVYAVGHGNWARRVLGDFPLVWAGIGKLRLFAKREFLSHVDAQHPELRTYEAWLRDVSSGQPIEQINLLQMTFPHVPYLVTTRGRSIQNRRLWADAMGGENYETFDSHINVLHHNYLQQAQATDALISNLIETLRAREIYDQSLIFVTADHGVSYSREGINRRLPQNEKSWINIMSVPLFVKYPNQKQGRVVESIATNLDIAPTLISVLGVQAPWEMQGETLEDRSTKQASRSASQVYEFDLYGDRFDELATESINLAVSLFTETRPISDISVNYTEDRSYDALLDKNIQEIGMSESDLSYSPLDRVFHDEITFAGVLRNERDEAVDDAILAISQNGTIVAITRSGRAKNIDGYVPFSLPERQNLEDPRDLKLFEVVPNGDTAFTLNLIADLEG